MIRTLEPRGPIGQRVCLCPGHLGHQEPDLEDPVPRRRQAQGQVLLAWALAVVVGRFPRPLRCHRDDDRCHQALSDMIQSVLGLTVSRVGGDQLEL